MASRKKKSVTVEKEEAKAEEMVRVFLAQMEDAADWDDQENRSRRPAFKKVSQLSTMLEMLGKAHLREALLAHDVLKVLKRWLSQLPDGSLPNVRIRTELLRALQNLAIDLGDESRKDQMKRSGLGTAVMFLSRCPDETAANRRVAADLVHAWSRQLGVVRGGAGAGAGAGAGPGAGNEVGPTPNGGGGEPGGGGRGRGARRVEDDGGNEALRLAKLRAWQEKRDAEAREVLAAGGGRPGDADFRMRARPPMSTARNFEVMPQARMSGGGGAVRGEGRTEFQRKLSKTIANIKVQNRK